MADNADITLNVAQTLNYIVQRLQTRDLPHENIDGINRYQSARSDGGDHS